MKFSDKIIRDKTDMVFIKATEKQANDRSLFNCNCNDVAKYGISFTPGEGKVNLYSVTSQDVKIGENIYDADGDFIAYRSE